MPLSVAFLYKRSTTVYQTKHTGLAWDRWRGTLCESTYTGQVDKGKCWSMRTPALCNIIVSPNCMEKAVLEKEKAYLDERQNSVKAIWTHMKTS